MQLVSVVDDDHRLHRARVDVWRSASVGKLACGAGVLMANCEQLAGRGGWIVVEPYSRKMLSSSVDGSQIQTASNGKSHRGLMP
jgi:hypothetical protein